MTFTIDQLNRILGFTMSEEQIAAVTADLARPLLVVAGAGSGKTTVMAARVLWAVGTGQCAPDEIVGLTFTKKAAGELGARVRTLLDKLYEDFPPVGLDDGEAGSPLVSTYHAFAHQFVAEHGLRIGVEPGARLLSETESLQEAYRVVVNTDYPLTAIGLSPASLAEVVVKLDQQLSEHLTTPHELREHDQALIERVGGLPKTVKDDRALAETAAKRIQLSFLVEEYRERKQGEGAVDFADVLRLGHQLAGRQDAQEIFHSRVRMTLLDEYQDTSVVQAELLAPLIGPEGSVTAVGDPLQAIYSWRGAGADAMADFARHFAGDGVEPLVLPLSTSHRSGVNVLNVANDIAEPMRAESAQVVILKPAPDGPQGPRRDAVRAACFETYREELTWLGDRIAEQLDVGTDPARIAILCRVTSDFTAVLDELHGRGIPAAVSGAEGLLAQPEVTDVISILQVINDPTQNPAMLRILMGPRMRIGPRDLALLGARAAAIAPRSKPRWGEPGHDVKEPGSVDFTESIHGTDPADLVSLAEAVDDLGPRDEFPYSDEAFDRLTRLSQELTELRAAASLPLPDLVSRVIAATGLDVEARLEACATSGLNAKPPQRGIAAIAALHELVNASEQSIEDRSLGGFLAWISVIRRVNRDPQFEVPTPPGAVAIMTVHKAKGLEWDVVAVPFMSNLVFPSTQSRSRWTSNMRELPHPLRGDRDSLPSFVGFGTAAHSAFKSDMEDANADEERRLGYVAVTRPTRLLLASGHWWGPTQSKPRGPSSLLHVVRERCVEARDDDPWVAQTDYEVNPARSTDQHAPWPPNLESETRSRRLAAAALVETARAALSDPSRPPATDSLSEAEEALIRDWDSDIEMLLAERTYRSESSTTQLPRTMSASDFMAAQKDRAGFLARRARPMPQQPSPAALRGTRFHNWVEVHLGQRPLFEELPGASDDELFTEEEMVQLRHGFLATEYADRTPYAVEVPFSIVVNGLVLKGRIDAVYRVGDRWEVVDWKTNIAATADPLQLAIYRHAWSQSMNVPATDIDGVFVYVRTSEVVRFCDLPDISEVSLSGEADPR